MNLADLRENYLKGGIRLADMHPDPYLQLEEWLKNAQDAGLLEPNAMTLSTSDSKGRISSRTVLLKGIEENDLQFFTNYHSRKARDITQNPYAAINFLWKDLERQICMRGTVQRTSREVSERYFKTRPYASKIGAWVSERQSDKIPLRSVLEKRDQALRERFPEDRDVPCPDFWGGYNFRPSHIEFWQGREGRIHDRIRYRHESNQWILERLSP